MPLKTITPSFILPEAELSSHFQVPTSQIQTCYTFYSCNLTLETSEFPIWLNAQFHTCRLNSAGAEVVFLFLESILPGRHSLRPVLSGKQTKKMKRDLSAVYPECMTRTFRTRLMSHFFMILEQGFEPQHLTFHRALRGFSGFAIPKWFLDHVCPSRFDNRSLIINV